MMKTTELTFKLTKNKEGDLSKDIERLIQQDIINNKLAKTAPQKRRKK